MRKQQQNRQSEGVRPSPEQMARAYRKSLEERGDMDKRRIDRAVQRYKEGLQK